MLLVPRCFMPRSQNVFHRSNRTRFERHWDDIAGTDFDARVYYSKGAMASLEDTNQPWSRRIAIAAANLINFATRYGLDDIAHKSWEGPEVCVTKDASRERTRYQAWYRNVKQQWQWSSAYTFKGDHRLHQHEIRRLDDEEWDKAVWVQIDEDGGVPEWYEFNGGDSDQEYWS